MAIDYTSGGPKLKGGLDANTMKIMGEASQAKYKVGKYAETGMEDALTDLGKAGLDAAMDATKQKKAEEKAVNDKLDKISDEVLALGGGLGDNYFDSIHDDMEELRQRYLAADNDKERARIFNEMNAYKTETEAAKTARNDLADSQKQGLFSNSMSTDDKHIISEFLGNKTTISKNADGQRVHTINMPDGTQVMMTADEINGLSNFKANEFDEMLTKDMQSALSIGQSNGYYNPVETKRKIENSITDDNIGSLINDPMGGGGSFKDDLAEGLKNSNLQYKDLGNLLEEGAIQPQNDEQFWYDNISEEDIQAISDALTNPNNQYYDPKVTKSALTNYFSAIVDNNNKSGTEFYEKSLVAGAEDKGQSQAYQQIAKEETLEEAGRGGNANIKGANVR